MRRVNFRLRLRTILLLVALSALAMTLELARERRAEFRGVAKRLTWMENDARLQAEGASSSAAYHRHRVKRGGLDSSTAAEWLARADRLDATADDWRKQADSFRRSKEAFERAAKSLWLPADPGPFLARRAN
jgi:hypothetical protein